MKFVSCLIIKKNYFTQDELRETVQHIETYVNNIDTLIIYNISNNSLDELKDKLNRFSNVIYINGQFSGQVYDYHNAIKLCYEQECDFASIMELGYYYEESVVNNIKKYILDNPDVCIVTPNPVMSCEEPVKSTIHNRDIMGCHLIGAFINIKYYIERGFKEKYYQTTFDYEYCLYHRAKGRKVVLLMNDVLRNTNYLIKERKFLFFRTHFYERDLMDVYYETRNRLYLWEEYKDIDPEYVRLDKKEFKKEVKEMRLKDKNYGDKKLMINRARSDFYLKRIGYRDFKY